MRGPSPAAPADPRCPLPAPVVELLERELVVWLATAREGGAPHILPLWFTWDGEAITLYSKPGAVKVRNIRRDPRVMVAVGTPGATFDVALLEGLARLDTSPVDPSDAAGGLSRYAGAMERLGVTVGEFLTTYSQAIRIRPSRVLDWGQPGWQGV
jgi:PPOX class probable F420-dependent enzyme